MTRVLISNRLSADFAMVPNALWQTDLPFAAKGVAAYLLSLRDGSMPYVAQMEAALGMGRDARRKAFAVLEACGFIEWRIERNASAQIVAKTLVLDWQAFGRMLDAPGRATENQADGSASHAPENPAGGKSTSAETEIRRCSDGKSGDTLREKKKERARVARDAARRSPHECGGGTLRDVGRLSDFQRSSIARGVSVVIDGECIKAGTAGMHALQEAVRQAERGGMAEKGAALCR